MAPDDLDEGGGRAGGAEVNRRERGCVGYGERNRKALKGEE